MLRDLLAKAGKRAGLCQVLIGESTVRKRRWPWGDAMAFAQNQTLALLGEPVRILSRAAWVEREQLAWCGRAHLDGPWLVVPRIKGPTLGQRMAVATAPEAIRALSASLHALGALHHRGLTHGDATCDNVCVHGDEATFFDFEQAHVGAGPAQTFAADDLVALVYSALTLLPSALVADVAEQALGPEQRHVVTEYARRFPRSAPYLQQARMDGRSEAYREVARYLGR